MTINNSINANSITPLIVNFGGTGDNTLTAHGILLGNTLGAITALAAATDGQIAIGSTGADPVLSTITAGTGISIVNSPGSITLSSLISQGIVTLDADSGSATGMTVDLAGGNNITTAAAGTTVTFSVTGTINHAVQIGNSSGSLSSLGVATNGQLIIGSTGSDPVLADITPGSGISITNGAGSITIASLVSQGIVTLDGDTGSATGTTVDLSGGPNITTSAMGSLVTFSLTGTTNHAVQIGNAGGNLTSLGVGTTGQVLIGATGADPAFGALGVNSGLTAHSLLLGQNNSAITALGVATNGQIPIGSSGADPILGTITPGTGITITNGAGSITVASSIAQGIVTLDGDTGSATGTTVTLAGGNNVTTSATASTVTLNVSGTTNHAVQVGNSTNSLTSLGVGTTGQVLIGSTSANPAFGALGVNSGLAAHGLLLGQNNAAITSLGDATNGQIPIGSTGLDPVLNTITAGAGVSITNGAGSITVASSITQGIVTLDADSGSATGTTVDIAGGNNITTSAAASTVTLNVSGTTNHAVQVGNSTGSLTSLGVGTTGQVLIGSTSANPSFGALGVNSGLTAHGILLGQNNSAITALGDATNGQIPIGSTGADPVLATLTAGSGVSVTNGAGSITVASTITQGIVTLDADTGSATGTTVDLAGGNNITTSATGSTVTFNVSGTTNHAVQVGNSTNSLTSLGVGTTGQVLIGSTSANPAFGALGVNSGLTANSLLLGQNNSAITALGAATNGQLPIGSTGANPVLATLTGGTGISVTNGAGSISIATAGSVADSFTTGSGTATPSSGVLTVPNGSNINTTGSGSTLTVNLVNSPSVSGSLTAGTTVTAGTDFIASAGTVSAPSYTFTGSTSTGLYAPAAGEFGLAAAGVNKFIYDGNSTMLASNYKFNVNTTTNQTTGVATELTLVFAGTVFNPRPGDFTSNTTYTAPATGIYLITVNAQMSTTAGQLIDLIFTNSAGSTLLFYQTIATQYSSGNFSAPFFYSQLISLTAADTVQVRVLTASAAATITTGCSWCMHFLSF